MELFRERLVYLRETSIAAGNMSGNCFKHATSNKCLIRTRARQCCYNGKGIGKLSMSMAKKG
jgi:hypothetical protein